MPLNVSISLYTIAWLFNDIIVCCCSVHKQDSSVVIYDLLFNCDHVVQLLTATSRDVGRHVAGHVTVSTPDCRRVVVVGDVRPDCTPPGERTTR